MLAKPLTIVAAGLAAATNAFLLPPGVSLDSEVKTDEPAFSILPFEVEKTAIASETQIVKVDCPGCPIVLQGQAGQFRMKHGSSHLDLFVSVDHAATQDRLLVNDFELYPRSDPFVSSLAAAVIPDFEADQEPKELAVGTQELGFSLMVRPTARDEATKTELISVHLQVIEIGNKFVSGLNTVRIDLIKSAEDALVIAKIEQVSADADKANGQCTTMACKWKAFVNDYVNRMKPAFKSCAGKMGHHMGHAQGSSNGHHMHQPRPQMHHNHHHTWSRLFAKFSHTILIPIVIGIVAGISVSLVGMVIGTLIIGTWRVFVRGQPFFRNRCPHRRRAQKAAAKDAALAEEKTGLMAGEETLPEYRDEEAKPADV